MAHDPCTLRTLASLPRRLLLGGLFGLGLGSGCTYIETHGEEECLDEFFECMDEADGPEEIEACEAQKESCLESCGDWRGDEHDDAGEGESSDGGEEPGRVPGDDGDAGDR